MKRAISLFLLMVCVVSAWAVSHQKFDGLLKKYVDTKGMVDYMSFKKDPLFAAYLKELKDAKPTAINDEKEKLAFWINAYNAFTIHLIASNMPLKSIKDLKDPWDKKFIQIGGKVLSLNSIEHEIIRKEFDEPRIHFALVCAAVSCPSLRSGAYSGKNLEQELMVETKKFLNSSKNSITENSLKLSPIFEWFKGDFEKHGSIQSFVSRYSGKRVNKGAAITYNKYSWVLNSK